MPYSNLEPHHVLNTDVDGNLEVWCPFEVVDGVLHLRDRPVTQTSLWAKEADPEELECPVCEVLNGQLHYLGADDHLDDPEPGDASD